MLHCDFFKVNLMCVQPRKNKNRPIIVSGSFDFSKVRGNVQIFSEPLIWHLLIRRQQMKGSRLSCVQNASAAAYLQRSRQCNLYKPWLCGFFFYFLSLNTTFCTKNSVLIISGGGHYCGMCTF